MPEQIGYRWSETGSLINGLLSRQGKEITIEVGTPATLLMWSDRYPATVIEVGKHRGRPFVVIQMDNYTAKGPVMFTENQDYEYERDPNGVTHRVSFRKGAWRTEDDTAVGFGFREAYRDPSF